MGIRLSEKHGVNPALEQCFVCMKDVGVVLFGHMHAQREYHCRSCGHRWNVRGETPQCPSCNSRSIAKGEYVNDPEAPRRVCLNKEPCAECQKLMELGVIFISVDEKKSDGNVQNPWRTGGWCVVKEEAVRRIFEDAPILDQILDKRMVFIEDDAWDKLGLPRGKVNAQTLPREAEAPAGEEREVVGDLMGNDWRVFPRTGPLDLATDEEREGVKMIIFLQKLSGVTETEERALAGWRGMTDHEREQTKLAYEALGDHGEG